MRRLCRWLHKRAYSLAWKLPSPKLLHLWCCLGDYAHGEPVRWKHFNQAKWWSVEELEN